MISFLKRVWGSRITKNIFLVISILFISGGAFNDGLTDFFWALPFVVLLYFSLPFNTKTSGVITVVAFLIMFVISGYKYYSPIVYPVIGQKVVFLEDVPVELFDQNYYYNEYFYSDWRNEGKDVQDTLHVPKGSVYYIKSIEPKSADLNAYHQFMLVNSSDISPIAVKSRQLRLTNFLPNDRREKAFCLKVDWIFCKNSLEFLQSDRTDYENWPTIDPMFYPFRLLSKLMWYPAIPLLGYFKVRMN